MNDDAGTSLLNRYLDDVCPDEDATALALAIEEDAELLALLCDYTSLEAGLQEHLGVAGERRMPRPRVVSFWHRHRTGLSVAAGAAACLVLWLFAGQRESDHGIGTGESPAITIRRFTGEGGRNAQLPSSPRVPVKGGNLRREEFRGLSAELTGSLSWWTTTGAISWNGYTLRGIPSAEGKEGSLSLPDDFFGVLEGRALVGTPSAPDDALAYGLRAAGITFPDGASARWINAEKTAFEAVNTTENLARIDRMIGDHANFGPRRLSILCSLLRIPPGEDIPPEIRQERIFTSHETEDLLRRHPDDSGDDLVSLRDPAPPSESEIHFQLSPGSGPFDWVQAGGMASFKALCELQMRQWRVGDVIFIAGLAGPVTPRSLLPFSDARKVVNADLEFELTLKAGESAVLHLGSKPDQSNWILMLRAGF